MVSATRMAQKMIWEMNAHDIEVLTVILGGLLSYALAHYVLNASFFEFFFSQFDNASQKANGYFMSQIARGLLMGLVGLFCAYRAGLSFSFLDLEPTAFLKSLGWALGAMVVFSPFIWASAKKPNIQAVYPELRVAPRDRTLVLNCAAGWFVFLLGYEIIFRGLILHYAVQAWGLWPGIAIMTGMYVLAHMHKPASETFICFIVGPIFAYLTLETGTLWTVVILHVTIAVMTENLAARFNPDFIAHLPEST